MRSFQKLFQRAKMSFVISSAILVCGVSGSSAIAQSESADQIKSELLLGLMQPLPITIVGPLMARDIEVSNQSGTVSVNLDGTMLGGMLPFGDVSFNLEALGDKRYKVSDLNLPSEIFLPGDMQLKVGSSSLDGVWSFETRSYETMQMTLNDVAVTAGGGAAQLAKLENLTIEIDQQGKANIDSSRLALTINGATATIPGHSSWNLGQVAIQVGTKTGEPLDIHSLLTQGLQAGLMSSDFERLMGTLDFLRNRQYEALEIQVSGQDIDINIERNGNVVKADTALISLTGGSVSEQRIGNLKLLIDGRDLVINTHDEIAFSALEVRNEVLIEELPLAAILNSVAQIQLAQMGAPVDAKMSDFYDAFLGFNLLSVSAHAVDLKTEISEYNGDKTNFQFDRAAYQYEFQGFKDLKGVVGLMLELENLSFGLPEMKTTKRSYDYDLGEYVTKEMTDDELAEAAVERELLERTIRLFAPTSMAFQGSITNFGDDLIYKILQGMPVDENLATNLIGAAAVIPTWELQLKSDLSYQTQIAGLKATSDVTYVPMRLLTFNPYTGTQSLKFSNWDAFIDEGYALMEAAEADEEALKVQTPVVAVLEAFAERDGETLTWDLVFDGETDYILINDRKFYYGGIFAMATGPMMSMFAMRGVLGGF